MQFTSQESGADFVQIALNPGDDLRKRKIAAVGFVSDCGNFIRLGL